VMARADRPAAAAFATNSAGESVPSEAVEWVCRSILTPLLNASQPTMGLPRARRCALIIEKRFACASLSPKTSSEIVS
jgi:hypothetical protein